MGAQSVYLSITKYILKHSLDKLNMMQFRLLAAFSKDFNTGGSRTRTNLPDEIS